MPDLAGCRRYNVVGHVKTVIILAGGCLFFGDDMPLKKLAGINVAMFGIIWYTQVQQPRPHATCTPLRLTSSSPLQGSGQG